MYIKEASAFLLYDRYTNKCPPSARCGRPGPPYMGPEGCNAKVEDPLGSKAAPAQAPIVRDTPLIRLQRYATRNLQLIREEMEALKINKRMNKALSKTNARGGDESQDHRAHQGRSGTQAYGGSLGVRDVLMMRVTMKP